MQEWSPGECARMHAMSECVCDGWAGVHARLSKDAGGEPRGMRTPDCVGVHLSWGAGVATTWRHGCPAPEVHHCGATLREAR